MPILPHSLVAGHSSPPFARTFRAVSPADGKTQYPDFHVAGQPDIDLACDEAKRAAPVFAALPGKTRAAFMRDLADRLLAAETELVERAVLETAIDADRLRGELARTARQLTLFAEDLEEGSWVDARIETADPARKPSPKPDHRSMNIPLGPVVVFGASNFPFAYSVAGCDTAAAFAAGCPVIAKAHPAHPGVSALTGAVVAKAVAAAGLPGGVFSLLFDDGHEVGAALVRDPRVAAVAFTGSKRGGRALMDIAAARPHPIPVYAEMGASNPVFLLPGALRERGEAIVRDLHASCTGGAGQFCTQPGLIFVIGSPETETFIEKLAAAFRATPPRAMLSEAIHAAYLAGISARAGDSDLEVLAAAPRHGAGPFSAAPSLFGTTGAVFLGHPPLADEIFGPTSLIIRCEDDREMAAAAESIEGGLAAAIHGEGEEADVLRKLAGILSERVGRVVYNGYTTGVEVSRAIVHGGPYPATSDGRTTSVGASASARFTRRVCWQNFPDAFLPPELRDENPLDIQRLVDGTSGRIRAVRPV